MIKINLEIDDSEKQPISAFAFETGRLIEQVINQRTNDLYRRNQELESKLLVFRYSLSEDLLVQYDEFFGIIGKSEGKL